MIIGIDFGSSMTKFAVIENGTITHTSRIAHNEDYLAYMQTLNPESASKIMICGAGASYISEDILGIPTIHVEEFDALANGGKGAISVAAACGIAGIISGCITMTGLASRIITAIITLSGGYKIVALFMTMLCCIVLGMGVPTTANYCIMASTCAPILIQLGVPKIAAHFFVFYFGIVADITPPVALAAYAGAAIAKANPMKTGVNATKLAIGAFVVPYIFALNPAMLFVDTTALQVVQIVITSLIGIFGVAAAMNGFLFRKIHWAVRIPLCAGGLMMMAPSVWTDIVGLVIMAAAIAWQKLGGKKVAGASK